MKLSDLQKFCAPAQQNLPPIRLAKKAPEAPLKIIPIFTNPKEKGSMKKGEIREFTDGKTIVREIAFGPASEKSARKIRRFYGTAYLAALASKPKSIAFEVDPAWIKWAAVGIHVAALNPALLRAEGFKEAVPEITFVTTLNSKTQKDLKAGATLAAGKNLVRMLGAFPPNLLHPKSYADMIEGACKHWKLKCKRLSEKELKPYGLLRAVSQGARHGSELLAVTVHPKKGATQKSTVIIGKGLCFDAGGLNIKTASMKSMKEDMAGSAIVLALLGQIAEKNLELKETTHFLFPLAENVISSASMRPDDIYTAGDGKRVEVANTDAEGRLVLADAICYAKKHFKDARRYMTVATLTGSCWSALADVYTALICNTPKLRESLVKAGEDSGDLVHPGPWNLDYDDYSAGTADLSNYGDEPTLAGWIKGGLFLNRFLPEGVEFAHFDIAGSIDMFEKGKAWRKKGFNSGVGVALLSEILS